MNLAGLAPAAFGRAVAPTWSWWSVLVWLAGALLLCGVGGNASAQVSPVARTSACRAVNDDGTPQLGKLELLRDATGSFDWATARDSTLWQPVNGAGQSFGYTSDAIWMRGTLCNQAERTVRRWLSVGSARLENVEFYRFSGDGDEPPMQKQAGTAIPMSQHQLQASVPVFEIDIPPGQQVSWMVRVSSRSAIEVFARMWTPDEFREQEGLDLAALALLVGPAMMVCVFTLLQGWSWGDRSFMLLALWIALAVAYLLSFNGYLYRYVFPGGGDIIVRAPGSLGTLSTLCYIAVTSVFVGPHRVRLWKWIYTVLVLLLVVAAAWTMFGPYRPGAMYSAVVVGAFYLVWFFSLIDVYRRGFPNAGLFFLSFVTVWVFLLIRLAEIGGLMPHTRIGYFSSPWIGGVAVIAMVAILATRRSRQMHTAHDDAQKTLMQSRIEEQARLEWAVVDRTRELYDALAAASAANKAKSDFLAGVSHDLRTPLTSIVGFAELIQGDGGESAERGRIIRRSAKHMLAMVNDIIDFARGDGASNQHVSSTYLHALIESVAQEADELARKSGNRLEVTVARGLPPVVRIDGKGLRRVLGNLLDNACKFTQLGTVQLRISQGDAPQPPEHVQLVFEVRDTGPGIDAADHQSIFEPFQRLKSAHMTPGVGLGLAIARQWANRAGGTLAIDSATGLGTTMTLTLSVALADERTIARHDVVDRAPSHVRFDGSDHVVWIAEDTGDIRQLLDEELSAMGFTTRTFDDGTGLIAATIAHDVQPPAIVLTDLMMPGADGAAVLGCMRQWQPSVPVVMLSAIPQQWERETRLGPLRFDAMIAKPIDMSELQATLARLLQLSPRQEPVVEAEAVSGVPVNPPDDELVTLRSLIGLGAMSDLIDWANRIEVDMPGTAAFAQRVRHLAAIGDITELEALSTALAATGVKAG